MRSIRAAAAPGARSALAPPRPLLLRRPGGGSPAAAEAPPSSAGPQARGGHRLERLRLLDRHPRRVATAPRRLQRDNGGSRVTVRSPVLEETVTQVSDLAAGLSGRSLTRSERSLATNVFGTSLDYERVRLIETNVLEYRTIGNTIRVPRNFTIRNEEMAQTLVHELTHVWQYQQRGTSYISVSLGNQIGAAITRGNRNFAYDYRIRAGQSFFDFSPEQQAFIVENSFAMMRDQAAIPGHRAAGLTRTYNSVHLGSNGFPTPLSATDRLTEISRELPLHQPLIRQMRAAIPRPEADLLQMRASELMVTPGEHLIPVPEERRLTPVRPLLEIRF